jgi:hypothetical protein
MWRQVDLVWTDLSEERFAYIFRVEKSASEKPAWAGGSILLLARRFFCPENVGDMFLRYIGSYKISTSQKTEFFIAAAVKTSTPTYCRYFFLCIDFSLSKVSSEGWIVFRKRFWYSFQDTYVFLVTLFWNPFSLCFYLGVHDKVAQPHKTVDTVVIVQT